MERERDRREAAKRVGDYRRFHLSGDLSTRVVGQVAQGIKNFDSPIRESHTKSPGPLITTDTALHSTNSPCLDLDLDTHTHIALPLSGDNHSSATFTFDSWSRTIGGTDKYTTLTDSLSESYREAAFTPIVPQGLNANRANTCAQPEVNISLSSADIINEPRGPLSQSHEGAGDKQNKQLSSESDRGAPLQSDIYTDNHHVGRTASRNGEAETTSTGPSRASETSRAHK